MQVRVHQATSLNGTICIPASKSETLRALVFGLLSQRATDIQRPLFSSDTDDMISVCRNLGAQIQITTDRICISPPSIPLETSISRINTGNSGITARFILPLLGLRSNASNAIIVDCGEQMRERPMTGLIDALKTLGMKINYLNNSPTLPVQVQGLLQGGEVTLREPISQFLSALLIALPLAPNDSVIHVGHIPAQGYVEITLAGLKSCGITIKVEKHSSGYTYHIPGNQTYQPSHQPITGDFSSASYLLAMGAMTPGKIILKGLSMHSLQQDKQCIDLLKKMGANIQCTHETIQIEGGHPLQGIRIDAATIPDLVPTLAVLGTYATGTTIIENAPQARLKETDRIHSMVTGLRALGAQVEELSDGMIVHQSNLQGTALKGFNDHRTVMALTVAGLRAAGKTTITDSEAVRKTFPDFFQIITDCGATTEMIS